MIRNATGEGSPAEMARSIHRILIVVEQRVLVDALTTKFKKLPGFEVVGTATTSDEGCRLAAELRPSLSILDADLPGGEAFDVCSVVQKETECAQCVFLAGTVADSCIDQALRLNAAGFLSKDEPIDAILEHVQRVAVGQPCFSKTIHDRLSYNPVRGNYRLRFDTPLGSLTNKQLEILRYLARGDSVKDVAARLSLSSKSVENHKYRIMNKVGVHNRVHLARFAIREGLIQP